MGHQALGADGRGVQVTCRAIAELSGTGLGPHTLLIRCTSPRIEIRIEQIKNRIEIEQTEIRGRTK